MIARNPAIILDSVWGGTVYEGGKNTEHGGAWVPDASWRPHLPISMMLLPGGNINLSSSTSYVAEANLI